LTQPDEWLIGHYARDLKIEPIAKMIEHMTSRSAKRLGIYPHRGCVAVGSAADLVLFDPKKIMDMATFESPKERCVGIRWVLVNGIVGMEAGVLTGKLGGKVLRKSWERSS
jgi:N-acyl-D-amino-acid deacylase